MRFDDFVNEGLLLESSMKMISGELEDGVVTIIADEDVVVGKRFWIFDKKKKIRSTYKKERGYDWYDEASGKPVHDRDKLKQLKGWADDLRQESKDKEKKKKDAEDEKNKPRTYQWHQSKPSNNAEQSQPKKEQPKKK